jgi:hypothetical protein
VRVVILLTCGKHLHDHIISLREVWVHKTSLKLPLVPSQENEWSSIVGSDAISIESCFTQCVMWMLQTKLCSIVIVDVEQVYSVIISKYSAISISCRKMALNFTCLDI